MVWISVEQVDQFKSGEIESIKCPKCVEKSSQRVLAKPNLYSKSRLTINNPNSLHTSRSQPKLKLQNPTSEGTLTPITNQYRNQQRKAKNPNERSIKSKQTNVYQNPADV